jgi:hypothetical protein
VVKMLENFFSSFLTLNQNKLECLPLTRLNRFATKARRITLGYGVPLG